MSITVVRKTAGQGNLMPLSVKMNGEMMGEVRENQSVHLDLPTIPASIQVSRWGFKSNLLEVQEGDTVEITNVTWVLIMKLATILLTVLSYFQDDPLNSPLIIAFLIGTALVSFFVEEYRIEKKD